ncbi:hypothetical protein [Brucella anthropi]|uniref:hypothetical protein n=1 Tax=Brucella anthropi TaxID=529 RepID=UPI003D95915E
MEIQRKPYRPDQRLALQRIEQTRIRLHITRRDLCDAAGISNSSYFRMCKSGRCFPRHIKSLRFALRTIEQKRKASEHMFSLVGDI